MRFCETYSLRLRTSTSQLTTHTFPMDINAINTDQLKARVGELRRYL